MQNPQRASPNPTETDVPEGSQRTTITTAGKEDPNLLHILWFNEVVRDVDKARAFSIMCLGDLDETGCLIGTKVVPALRRAAAAGPNPKWSCYVLFIKYN